MVHINNVKVGTSLKYSGGKLSNGAFGLGEIVTIERIEPMNDVGYVYWLKNGGYLLHEDFRLFAEVN